MFSVSACTESLHDVSGNIDRAHPFGAVHVLQFRYDMKRG